MSNHLDLLNQRLKDFRKKYYSNKIIRGSLILVLITSSILFVVLLSEGIFGFSSSVRTAIVFGLLALFVGVLGLMVIFPLLQWLNIPKTISDFQIAQLVRSSFPEINDKLTNFLQLRSEYNGVNGLASAAINQKAGEIAPVKLSSAINLNVNARYAKYLLIPLLLFVCTWLINPSFISGSTYRLVNYNRTFEPPAPFSIVIEEVPDQIVSGESFKLNVLVSDARELPRDLYIFLKKDSESRFINYTLEKTSDTDFQYTLSDFKENFSFYIGNPEVRTGQYEVEVLKRPFINNFNVVLDYPDYTGISSEKLDENVGDFKVIKGTRVRWELVPNGDISSAQFISNDTIAFDKADSGNRYIVSKQLMENLEYFISLVSPESVSNIDTVNYRADVIPDRYPTIYVYSPKQDFLIDLDLNMPLELEIADDFGFQKMKLLYRFTKSGGTSEVTPEYLEYNLPISRKLLVQPQTYNIDLSELGIREGDEVEFMIKVWDNDGISGPKSSVSGLFNIVYPTLEAKYDEIGNEQEKIKEDLESMKKRSEELKESYQKMQEKLLDKKRLSFDDKKEMQQLVEEHQSVRDQMKEAQEEFEQTKNKLADNQMISEETLSKYEELNEFMEDLDNPEVEEMLRELMEQMENINPEELREKLENLQMDDKKMQNSIERTLELLKQLEVQQKIDELRNKIDNMKTKQDMLQEQLDKAENQQELNQNLEKQENLKDQLEGIKKDIEELDEMKENTKTPDKELLENLDKDKERASKDMENAVEEMKKAKGEQSDNQEGKSQQENSENQDNNDQSDSKEGDSNNPTDEMNKEESSTSEEGKESEGNEQKENEGEKENSDQSAEEGSNEQNSEQQEGSNQQNEQDSTSQQQQGDQQQNGQQEGDQQQQNGEQQQGDQQQNSQQQQGNQQQNNQPIPQQQQKNASQFQKNASQKLQEMSEQLGNMQMNMQAQQDQQNLENLRELIENLLKLSFDQEDLRDEVKELKYGDPSLKDKSQEQKKLQDDMGLLRDSLESLANKVFQIKKFVLDEVENITNNMERSQTFFRNKQISMVEFHQQSAMTSINNLANMLSDVMKQIQENMMSGQMGAMCQKPGQIPNFQQIGEQQQQLNQQMQQMMNSGDIDYQKLQEMAAQQEALRKQLKDAHEQMKQNGGKSLGDMDKVGQDMQQTETELINRQLTHETLLRQQQILSRLLQADKAVRQRELDDKRESTTGRELDKISPEELSLEEYKNKIRQELLKSNKLEYSPDFMILIERYFKKLEESQP